MKVTNGSRSLTLVHLLHYPALSKKYKYHECKKKKIVLKISLQGTYCSAF